MEQTASGQAPRRHKSQVDSQTQWSVEHYLRLILHRIWLVVGTFVVVSVATFILSYRMVDTYRSETVILVDPQKVPEAYVRSTVTGDIRGRLSTLSQQILSATRLQKIIDSLNLYPTERKSMAREDVLTKMRSDIGVTVLSEFGGGQDLQAFRITYSGRDPRLVARVANELASLFIEENLKAREQQATGTTEFLQNQLQETRKVLDDQEAKLRDFKLKHVGEMPEHQGCRSADSRSTSVPVADRKRGSKPGGTAEELHTVDDGERERRRSWIWTTPSQERQARRRRNNASSATQQHWRASRPALRKRRAGTAISIRKCND